MLNVFIFVFGCITCMCIYVTVKLIGIGSLVNGKFRLTNLSQVYSGVTLWSQFIWHDSMVMILRGANDYSLDLYYMAALNSYAYYDMFYFLLLSF